MGVDSNVEGFLASQLLVMLRADPKVPKPIEVEVEDMRARWRSRWPGLMAETEPPKLDDGTLLKTFVLLIQGLKSLILKGDEEEWSNKLTMESCLQIMYLAYRMAWEDRERGYSLGNKEEVNNA